MGAKNYTDVLIDGKVYTLGGIEEESYLQQVAGYINDKLALLRRQEGFLKQNDDYQSVMALLNLADDYFKERERFRTVSNQKAELEKEIYSLKHELVGAQMRLETAQDQTRELSSRGKNMPQKQTVQKSGAEADHNQENSGSAEKIPDLKKQLESMKEELNKYRALEAAETARRNRK